MVMIGATVVCGLLLVLITCAFLYSDKFRTDVLAQEGEAQVVGILNAKGATVVVLLALFLGAVLWGSARSAGDWEQVARVIPAEAPALAERINDDLVDLKALHVATVHTYFDAKRSEVERFFYREWLPRFSLNMSKLVREELGRKIRQEGTLSAETLSDMNEAQQKELSRRLGELQAPLSAMEDSVTQVVAAKYDEAIKANQAVLDLLRRVRGAR